MKILMTLGHLKKTIAATALHSLPKNQAFKTTMLPC